MCKKKETISDERVAMFVGARIWSNCDLKMHSQICSQPYMSQLLLLGKFEYGGGPIFKVVLEC